MFTLPVVKTHDGRTVAYFMFDRGIGVTARDIAPYCYARSAFRDFNTGYREGMTRRMPEEVAEWLEKAKLEMQRFCHKFRLVYEVHDRKGVAIRIKYEAN